MAKVLICWPQSVRSRLIALFMLTGAIIAFWRQLKLLKVVLPQEDVWLKQQDKALVGQNDVKVVKAAAVETPKATATTVSVISNNSTNATTTTTTTRCSYVRVPKEAEYKPLSLYKEDNRRKDDDNNNWKNQSKKIEPIWVPSYPGSGSELFRNIILTLTGGKDGANFYDSPHRCSRYPATCKTHCPFLQPINCPKNLGLQDPKRFKKIKLLINNYYHKSVMLLLRNPKNAMPSYINWQYESKTEGLDSHSIQAPESYWKQRRDDSFERLFGGWKQHLIWWSTTNRQSIYDVSLVIPYERITNEQYGPTLLKRVGQQLQLANIPLARSSLSEPTKTTMMDDDSSSKRMNQQSTTTTTTTTATTTTTPTVRTTTSTGNSNQNSTTIHPNDDHWYECVWQRVVRAPKSTTKRTAHRYVPSYTKEQQDIMIKRLDELIQMFSNETSSTIQRSDDDASITSTTITATALRKNKDLIEILSEYRHDITTNLRIDE